MPITTAQRRAKDKYDKANYSVLQIKPKKDEAAKIRDYTADRGESLTRFLVRAAETQMEADKTKEQHQQQPPTPN